MLPSPDPTFSPCRPCQATATCYLAGICSLSHSLTGVRNLISAIGDDPWRPGLQDTPERFVKAWLAEWGAGYRGTPEDLVKLFPFEENEPVYDEMVHVRGIAIFSHCEHHLAPFFGDAHIAYVPGRKGIVGLSKLARVVDHFARRLQVQERLTAQIAGFLEEHVSKDVGVWISAAHLCMISRGVRQPNARTITTALRGEFRDDLACREEFLRATREG